MAQLNQNLNLNFFFRNYVKINVYVPQFPLRQKLNSSTLHLKTTLKDDFSSESCSPSRDIISNDDNKTTQVESVESNNQPETISRLGKALFTSLIIILKIFDKYVLPQSLKKTPPHLGRELLRILEHKDFSFRCFNLFFL